MTPKTPDSPEFCPAPFTKEEWRYLACGLGGLVVFINPDDPNDPYSYIVDSGLAALKRVAGSDYIDDLIRAKL